MTDELLRARDDDGVLWLTLDRPHSGNALTASLREALITELEAASGDLRIRAVVVRANGPHFCTGADLRADRPPVERPEGAPERPAGWIARTISTGAQRLTVAVLDCEKPVLGVVRGAAAGIGAHLALACDLVVADDTARFIEVFARRGIVPDGGGAYLLPRFVGLHTAKEWVLFGDDIGAAEALATGLVNRVVPAADLDDLAAEWARRLATGPTIALGWAKRMLNASLDDDRGAALRLEAAAQEIVRRSDDAAEGMGSFRDRREPAFRGW